MVYLPPNRHSVVQICGSILVNGGGLYHQFCYDFRLYIATMRLYVIKGNLD